MAAAAASSWLAARLLRLAAALLSADSDSVGHSPPSREDVNSPCGLGTSPAAEVHVAASNPSAPFAAAVSNISKSRSLGETARVLPIPEEASLGISAVCRNWRPVQGTRCCNPLLGH